MKKASFAVVAALFLAASWCSAQTAALPPGFQLPPGVSLPPGLDLEKLLQEVRTPAGGAVATPAAPAPKPDETPPSAPPKETAPAVAAPAPPAVEPKPAALGSPAPPETGAPTPKPGLPAPESEPAKPQELRNVLAEIRQSAPAEAEAALPVFGFDLFEGSRTFQPLQGLAVPDSYVVGPGDSFRVTVWGRFEADYTLTVEPEGTVLFPKIGQVRVSGLTYAEARRQLKGKAESITGVNASVVLGSTRTFQVFVVGEAQKPGTYTLPPFSTAMHAVLAAGGPTSLGSLRHITIRRGGKAVLELDLYQFILQGAAQGDRPVQNGDVVLIPRAKTKVWASGKFKRPAIYELKGSEGLRALIDFAGGLTPDAYGGRIQVERSQKNRARVVLDVPFSELVGDFALQDGDAVRIFPLKPEVENRVSLFGHVYQPGTYEFRKGMRVSDLLKSTASLKPDVELSYAIVLREAGADRAKLVAPFRVGAALDGSDPTQNVSLQALDEVYIFSKYQFRAPLRAVVQGEVRAPGPYRLEPGTTVADLLRLAGGLTPEALLSRAEVLRYRPDRTRVTNAVDLAAALRGDPAQNLLLEDEDTLVVHSVKEPFPDRTVVAAGEVQKPGSSALTQGMRVADLIFRSGDLTKDAYRGEAHIFRTHPETQEVSFLKCDLRKALAGDERENLLLQDRDRLVVYSAANLVIQKSVRIEGMVKKPGDYVLGEGMRVSDLVLKADGLTKDAYRREGHLFRTAPDTKEITIRVFDLGKALEGAETEDILLQDQDRVTVHSAYEFAPAQKVVLSGTVNKPGEHPYATNMTVRDLILAGGGLKEEAFLGEAEVVRSETTAGEKTEIVTLRFPLSKAMEGNPEANLALKPYDKVFVKKIPEWRETEKVELSGEVAFPGTYFIAKGERLSSVLRRAGGFTAEAYLRGAVFTRQSAREQQQQRLNEMRDRLQQAVLRASSAEAQAALTPEDLASQKQYLAAQDALVKKLENVKATGRVVLTVLPLGQLEGSEWDVALEEGDTLAVPKVPQTVTVVGQVYNPTSLLFEPGSPQAGHYLQKTGGPTSDAEKGEIYVVRADGSVVSNGSLKAGSWWARGVETVALGPGDTVLVPEKVIQSNYMRDIRDITQILYQIAVTAGVAVALF